MEEPDASRAIDTDRIAVRLSPVEISYYEGARWSDRAPRLVQSLMIESFDNAGVLEHVGRTGTGVNAQYAVKSNLIAFQADTSGGRPTIMVKLKITVLERRRAQIIASRIFEASRRSDGAQTKDVVLTFNEATGDILAEAVAWTLSTLESSAAPASGS